MKAKIHFKVYDKNKVDVSGDTYWIINTDGVLCYLDNDDKLQIAPKSTECLIRNIKGKMMRHPLRAKTGTTINSKDFKVVCHNNNWQFKIITTNQYELHC